MASRCPLCRTPIPGGGTHCPRCNARVAALPRHARVPKADLPDLPTDLAEPGQGGGIARAAGRGALYGACLAAIAIVVGLGVRAAGGDGNAAYGNLTLLAAGIWLCGAVAAGGLRLRRWADREEALARLQGASSIGTRRVLCIAAAAVLFLASGVAAALR